MAFEACFNFRDLGGYSGRDGRTVRWGRLFRSDTLHRLTVADLEAFSSLGLSTVVDLRTDTELQDHGTLCSDGRSLVEWHHVPLFDGVMRLQPGAESSALRPPTTSSSEPQEEAPGAAYVGMLGDGAGAVRVFELLLGPGSLPAVFHCTSGKDRTGMVAAMSLDLLGVDDETIAHDYELTNLTRERSNQWIAAHEPVFAAFLAQIPPERRTTRAETILAFLSAIRERFGSVEGMLVASGMPPRRIEAFRDSLLEA